jgi:hypothetical protein
MKKYIEKKLDGSFKEHEQKNVIKKELTEIKKSIQDNEKEQTSLLNGVFYSIKKLISTHNKEKEVSEDFTAQFRSALDVLYGHVRRLESEKDELSVELMRLAGDDFLNNKYAELEKELKKAKTLADEHMREKTELESKLKKFQHLWKKSAASKG